MKLTDLFVKRPVLAIVVNLVIIVAGIQSVYQRARQLGHFDLVLIDEAHLIPPDGDGPRRR